jgi:transglutaminase-like putative cysteine protease
MTERRHLALVAGAATVLASTAFAGVFDRLSWLPFVVACVAAVVAATIGARALRAPVWAQPFAGLLAMLVFVTVVFGDGSEILGVVPTPGTFAAFGSQLQVAFTDISQLAAPVPVRRGLLLLTVLGMGLVAILVDLLAVGLRRVALAGLPLLGLYGVPVSVDRDGLSWVPFALGAAGFLWLLGTEHAARVRSWGRPFHVPLGSGPAGQVPAAAESEWGSGFGTTLGATGRRVAMAGVAAAVLLPALVPGLTAQGWFGLVGDGDIGPGGGRTVTTINPATELRGSLNRRSPVEMLRIRTDDNQPLYLRLATLDQYTGRGWTMRGLRADKNDRLSNGLPPPALAEGVPTREQKTRIEIRGLTSSRYLPVYPNPTDIDARGDWRWDQSAETVFSTVNRTGRLRYTMTSQRVLYSRQLLARAPSVSRNDAVPGRYLSVGGGVQPQIETKVAELTAGKVNQYAIVMAINEYFSTANGFRYDLSTGPGSSEDALVDFVLTSKRGYCEQFASAMAYMVRSAGIPARVAVGFGYGEPTRDGYRSVTSWDAHAWVEVYFSGLGWVPFDPTPPRDAGRTGGLSWTQPAAVDDPITGGTPDDPAANQGDPSAAPTAGVPLRDPDAARDTQGANASRGGIAGVWDDVWSVRWWVLGVAALLALALVPAAARVRLRRRRRTLAGRDTADPVQAAHAAWDEVVDSLTDLRMDPDDAETPRALARRVGAARLHAPGREALGLLAGAEERARYAPRTVREDGLGGAVDQVRSELMAGSGRAARLRAVLVPTSLIDRVTLASQRWTDDIATTVAHARRSLLRRALRRAP